jgi:iron complex outermembrane receptor protein
MNIRSMKALPSLLIPAFALSALPFITINGQAQSVTHSQQVSNDSFFSRTLAPVSVYAVKGKTPQKTYQLKSADWIQHDATQVLTQIAGFNAIRKSGNFGFDPVFRGFKWEQLNLVTDGVVGAHQACPNRMDPPSSQVMINQIKEIELLKGPHNFRYGPSTGAVINFKMNDPVFSDKAIVNGRVGAGYETNGTNRRTEANVNLSTQKFQSAAALSYSAGDDYKDGSGTLLPGVFNRTALNLSAAYLIKPGKIASVNITRNFTRNTSFPTLMMDLLSDDTWMIQGKYQVNAQHKWYSQWNTQVYTSLVDHQMGNGLRPASTTMLSHVFANTKTSGGRTEITIRKPTTVWYMGADMKYEYANGTRSRKMLTGMMAGKTFYDTLWQQGSIIRTGAFVHTEKKMGLYQLTVSGRMDWVHSKPNLPAAKTVAANSTLISNDLNASISAGISRYFNQRWQASFWVGRGVRSASLTEKFINYLPVGFDAYEVVGNPHLKPEANTQIDLLVKYQTDNTQIQVNAYYAFMHNYISTVVDPTLRPALATSPGVRKFINVKDATIMGFELSWNQQLAKILNQDITMAYVRGQNSVLNQPLPEINPFEIRYKLTADLFNSQLQPYLSVRQSFAQNRVSAAFNERATGGFTVTDLGLKWKPVTKIQLSAVAQNLFNVTYREHLSRFINNSLPLNAPGRNFVFMMAYTF